MKRRATVTTDRNMKPLTKDERIKAIEELKRKNDRSRIGSNNRD